MTDKSYHVRAATHADVAAMAALAAQTFTETFGPLYTPENLAAHLQHYAAPAVFEAALTNGDLLFLLEYEGAIVGYAKGGQVALPLPQPAPAGSYELQRLYVQAAHHRRGFGQALLQALLSAPVVMHAPALYLGVWEENLTAQAFYHRFGFRPIGDYLYSVGTQSDREIIMQRLRVRG